MSAAQLLNGQGNPLGTPYKTALGMQPIENLIMPFVLGFTAPITQIYKDLQQEMSKELIGMVQTMYIDNSFSAQTFTIAFGPIGSGLNTLTLAAGKQGILPVTAPVGPLQFTANSTGAVNVQLTLYSFMLPYLVW